MTPSGLTPMQRACLTIIAGMEADGLSPSYDDLRAGLGLASKSGVHRILHSLKERGCVDWLPGRARSIRIIDQEWTPAALQAFDTDKLKTLAAHVAAVLAVREGGEAVFRTFDRIGRRVSGRPLNGGMN